MYGRTSLLFETGSYGVPGNIHITVGIFLFYFFFFYRLHLFDRYWHFWPRSKRKEIATAPLTSQETWIHFSDINFCGIEPLIPSQMLYLTFCTNEKYTHKKALSADLIFISKTFNPSLLRRKRWKKPLQKQGYTEGRLAIQHIPWRKGHPGWHRLPTHRLQYRCTPWSALVSCPSQLEVNNSLLGYALEHLLS